MKKIFLLPLLLLVLNSRTQAQNKYADSLRNQLQVEPEDTNKVKLLSDLAWVYMWSFADTAVSYAQKELELSKKIKYKSWEAHSMLDLCYSLTVTGNFTSALNFGFKAIAICESLHDSTPLVGTYDALGICYRDQSDYNEALLYEYKAKNLFESIHPSKRLSPIILGNISSIYEKKNQLDSALYYGNKSYQLSKSWSGILQTLGNIYYKLKQDSLALDYYRKGLAVATQQNDYRDLIDIDNGMSNLFSAAGKTDSAIYYANRAIGSEGAGSYPTGILETSRHLAHLYELKNNNDSVARYLKLTIAFNDSLFSRQKTREAQSFLFNEKLHEQELTAQQKEDRNKINIFGLLSIIVICLLIGFFFGVIIGISKKPIFFSTAKKKKFKMRYQNSNPRRHSLFNKKKWLRLVN